MLATSKFVHVYDLLYQLYLGKSLYNSRYNHVVSFTLFILLMYNLHVHGNQKCSTFYLLLSIFSVLSFPMGQKKLLQEFEPASFFSHNVYYPAVLFMNMIL